MRSLPGFGSDLISSLAFICQRKLFHCEGQLLRLHQMLFSASIHSKGSLNGSRKYLFLLSRAHHVCFKRLHHIDHEHRSLCWLFFFINNKMNCMVFSSLGLSRQGALQSDSVIARTLTSHCLNVICTRVKDALWTLCCFLIGVKVLHSNNSQTAASENIFLSWGLYNFS